MIYMPNRSWFKRSFLTFLVYLDVFWCWPHNKSSGIDSESCGRSLHCSTRWARSVRSLIFVAMKCGKYEELRRKARAFRATDKKWGTASFRARIGGIGGMGWNRIFCINLHRSGVEAKKFEWLRSLVAPKRVRQAQFPWCQNCRIVHRVSGLARSLNEPYRFRTQQVINEAQHSACIPMNATLAAQLKCIFRCRWCWSLKLEARLHDSTWKKHIWLPG